MTGTAPPLVAAHDTWISIDPLYGCPARCDYCYLGSNDAYGVVPVQRISPQLLLNELERFLAHESVAAKANMTPVAIGNYTDMLMTEKGRSYLLEFVGGYSGRFPRRPICLITKARIDEAFLSQLGSFGVPIFIFLSQSFASQVDRSVEKGPTCSPDQTLKVAAMISETENLMAIHFWRPFIARFNPVHELEQRIVALREAGFCSSVVVGLKTTFGMQPGITDSYVDEVSDHVIENGQERFAGPRWEKLRSLAAQESYSVYRNTSCSIAGATQRYDQLFSSYSASALDRCARSICPPAQRAICASTEVNLGRTEVEAALGATGIDSEWFFEASEPIPVVRLLTSISEYAHNHLTHLLRAKIAPNAVTRDKAWLGTITKDYADQ